MTKRSIIMAMMIASMLTSFAQNRWNIYAGGSISHYQGGYFKWDAEGNTNFDWGGGAFLGGGYEVGLNNRFSLTPAIELSFTDNGAYYNKTGLPAYDPFGNDKSGIWSSAWAINIPITAGFRIPLNDMVRFKIDAGPYLSEAFSVKHYAKVGGTNENPIIQKKKSTSDFGQDFQIGIIGGVAVETGNHFSYFFRTQYPFLKDRWSSKTITLAIGVKYAF